MTITYKYPTEDPDPMFKSGVAVIKLETGQYPVYIPQCEGNTDYQEWKEWVAEGHTTEEAD